MLVQRIPAGAFRCKSNVPVQYIDMLVLRKMDKVAYRLAEELEERGYPSFVTAAQETDWNYKRASYGGSPHDIWVSKRGSERSDWKSTS